MIDLHVHSTFSDGSLTPEQLVESAEKMGLSALGLTDHDTVAGIGPFIEACGHARVRGIPGVEISAEVAKGTMHILGYHIDHSNEALCNVLRKIRNGREVRNRDILRLLNESGIEIAWGDVTAFAGGEVVGRPHFAQAMVAKGYVRSAREAFDKYLARGKRAYVDRFRLLPADSILLILDAGGVPVLAHPSTLELGDQSQRTCVQELVGAGLAGVEVYYSEHTPRQVTKYLALAREFGLVCTGGSDFHGAVNPEIKIGVGFGSLRVPDEAGDELYARLQKIRSR